MLLSMGSSQPGSVKRDELGFTALCWRALCWGLLGHWGLLLRRAAGGRHLWEDTQASGLVSQMTSLHGNRKDVAWLGFALSHSVSFLYQLIQVFWR